MEETPLHQAASDGELDEVKRLVEAGADVNARTQAQGTPLHWAVQGDRANPAVISYLVEHGADVNAKNSLGYTPLHFASLTGNIPAVERLLELGADTSIPDKHNQTPVDRARGKVKAFFKDMERKGDAKGLAMVSVSKQIPYDLVREIGKNLNVKPTRFTPQSAKGRKTRVRKTKRRLTRRRK
jgi:hypothetical protein